MGTRNHHLLHDTGAGVVSRTYAPSESILYIQSILLALHLLPQTNHTSHKGHHDPPIKKHQYTCIKQSVMRYAFQYLPSQQHIQVPHKTPQSPAQWCIHIDPPTGTECDRYSQMHI